MKNILILAAAFCLTYIAGCHSVQKSVDPTGQGPIPRGSDRNVDRDTIKAPVNDSIRVGTSGSALK